MLGTVQEGTELGREAAVVEPLRVAHDFGKGMDEEFQVPRTGRRHRKMVSKIAL